MVDGCSAGKVGIRSNHRNHRPGRKIDGLARVLCLASRRSTKTIVCSGSRRPDAPPFGVSAQGDEGAYNAEAANLAFLPLLVKTNTDKAYAMTLQHGGDAILKKNAQQPVIYVLLKDRKLNMPVWYVIYGTSEKDRKGIGVINATTGMFVSAGK